MENSHYPNLDAQVSLFERSSSAMPIDNITIRLFLEQIQQEEYLDLVCHYRRLLQERPEEAKKFKRDSLPAITYSGKFRQRADNRMIQPSAVIILDIDSVPHGRTVQLKAEITDNPHTLAVFTSPSGDGLKVVVPVVFGWGKETYEHRYIEVLNYYARMYNIPVTGGRKATSAPWGFDLSCKNISRLCIISADKDIGINYNARTFTNFSSGSHNEESISRILSVIEAQKIDITAAYQTWFELICALKHELGEDARTYVHTVSKFYPGYSPDEVNNQFDHVNTGENCKITIATFFDIVKKHSINVTDTVLNNVRTNIIADKPVEFSLPPVIDDVPFPVDALPPPFSTYIREAAKSINCPVDYMGIAVLTAISGVMGRKFVISPKPLYEETGILFSVLIGNPGQKKSPALKRATDPIRKIQQEMLKVYKTALARYEQERVENPQAVKPTLERIATDDFTMEALGVLLEENPLGLIVIADELTSFVNSLNQYKKVGNDRQKVLSLWSAADFTIDRKNQQPKIIHRPFVSIIGGIQPDVIKGFSKYQNDGFLDRFLFVFPAAITPEFRDDTISPELINIYNERLIWLWHFGREDFFDHGLHSSEIRLGGELRDAWKEYINEHHRETGKPDFPYYLKGVWSKMEGYSLRLMLISAFARSQTGKGVTITADDVQAAVELTEYFKAQTKKVFKMIYSDEIDEKVVDLYNYLTKNGGRESVRNVYRARIGGCRNAAEANSLFEQMQERGLGRIVDESQTSGSRKSRFFILSSS